MNTPTRWLLVALLLHAALTATWAAPGPLSIDETTYQLMARAFSHGTVAIENGMDVLPSEALQVRVRGAPFVGISEGRLVGKYPPLFPMLGAALYPLLGPRALFALNGAAWVLVLALLYHLARRLTGDRAAAGAAASVAALGTFAWDYALAAWPHLPMLAAALGALHLTLTAQEAPAREARRAALGAGLLAGVALTLRLDGGLVLPVIGLALLWSRRVSQLLWVGLGLVPGVALLMGVNLARWGDPSPLSYGPWGAATSHQTMKVVPGIALGLGVGLGWALHRWGGEAGRRWAARGLGGAAAGAAIVALAWAPAREGLGRALVEGWALLGDLRALPDHPWENLQRQPSGAVYYLGGVKKALLQSCPWLPLALAAPWCVPPERRVPLALFVGVPILAWILPFAPSGWHGGQALNLRYELPAVMLATIPAGLTLTALLEPAGRLGRGAGILLGSALVALFLATSWPTPPSRAWEEGLMLGLPLALAAALAVGSLGVALRGARPTGGLAAVVLGLGTMGVAWGGVAGWLYDVPRSYQHRAAEVDTAQMILDHTPERPVLLLVTLFSTSHALYGRDGVVVADIFADKMASLRPLIDAHLDAGRAVYGYLPLQVWKMAEGGDRLAGLVVTPVHTVEDTLRLARIERAPAP